MSEYDRLIMGRFWRGSAFRAVLILIKSALFRRRAETVNPAEELVRL